MSATRGMLRSLAETSCTPSEVLTKLNRLLVEDFPAGRFVTMVYAVLDPARRKLLFSQRRPSATAFGCRRSRRVSWKRKKAFRWESVQELIREIEVDLPKDSRLVLYSDGITEAENGEQDEYGAERLQNHVLRPEASAESILADVRLFANGTGLRDDATVIFVRA